MMEIRIIRLELQQKKESLLNTDFRIADKRLSDFLNFINQNPILLRIVSKLPKPNIDWVQWEGKLWNATDYQFPEGEVETAGMCYEILTRYQGDKLVDISTNFHVSTNNITDHVQKYLETFLPFLYDYLDKRLLEAETIISPIDMIKDIEIFVDENTLTKYPQINIRLKEAYKKLFTAETNDDYIGVSNICRSIIIDFANQIFKNEYLPEGIEIPKGDDAKDKLKYTYKYFNKKKSDNFAEGREKMILGLWQMISANVHRKNISESEIKECVLYTYMLIKAFIEILPKESEK